MSLPAESLSEFNDLHLGARAFALGNGPSLGQMDLSPLAGEITFAANRFYRHADAFGFTPTYLCCSDPDVYREIEPDLPGLSSTCFLPHIGRGFRPDPPGPNCHALEYHWGPGKWLTPENFRRTLPGPLHSGNTVMIDFIIQLAYCMGIRTLYLLGCDCTKAAGRHFYNAGETSSAPILRAETVFHSYEVCQAVYASDGRRLLNAGLGGQLEVLPRVRFTSLFPGEVRCAPIG